VQLPGRESRFLEAPVTAMDAAVDELAPTIVSTVDVPFVFFGHSMGALIAFNVTRRLAAAGAPLPRHLFVSGPSGAALDRPRNPCTRYPRTNCSPRLGDTRLANLDPELRELVVPILRSDLTLCETYRHQPARALPLPITAFGGHDDQLVSEESLAAWASTPRTPSNCGCSPAGTSTCAAWSASWPRTSGGR